MPLTVPAHQVVVLPVKMRWPDRVDGTALFIGAAAPDLAYALSPYMASISHRPLGLLIFSMPYTLIVCWLLRAGAAGGVFGVFPDAGPWRIHSYRVLSYRHPAVWLTVLCAAAGCASHALIDSFTHTERWGAVTLGLDQPLLPVPGFGEVSGAGVLQMLGHTMGSAVSLYLLYRIGRERRLEQWYGEPAVAEARRVPVPRMWRLAVAGALIGAVVLGESLRHQGRSQVIFSAISAVAFTLPLLGLLIDRLMRRRTAHAQS